MEGPGDILADPHRRVTDSERDAVVVRLRAAVVDGSIDLDELGERIELAFHARTAGELVQVTSDLPAAPPAGAPGDGRRRSVWRNPGFRGHAAVYGLVNGFLVGTWAVTGGGLFWPFFPAAGWGVGLGVHAMATTAYEQQRHARRRRRARLLPPGLHPAPATGGSAVRAPHRRPTDGRLALLFTDIVGSTQLSAALGDASWSQLRSRFRAIVAGCLREHGGTEVNVAGDGILARLPDEVAAVRCAADVHRLLRRQRDETGFAPSLRTAVHAGDAVVDDGDVLGAAVNLVCRVAGEADPDEVLVTEAVAERLGDRFVVEDRGLRQLKGHTESRHLLAVRWE